MSGMSERPETVSHIAVMRTPLGRARGLGSAKEGSGVWWAERVTSVALVPLTLWFVWHVVAFVGAPHAAVVAWMQAPLNMVLMLCLVLTTFHHMHMGLQVVIEDYIHQAGTRIATLLAVRGVTALLAIAAVVSILKLGFSAGRV
jgi:succinate dehydrogenase / fumarate reductase membrane anchor subunit